MKGIRIDLADTVHRACLNTAPSYIAAFLVKVRNKIDSGLTAIPDQGGRRDRQVSWFGPFCHCYDQTWTFMMHRRLYCSSFEGAVCNLFVSHGYSPVPMRYPFKIWFFFQESFHSFPLRSSRSVETIDKDTK